MNGDPAAVPLSGEAFTVVAVLFVTGMLLIVLLRARAKSKAARPPAQRSYARRSDGGDGGHVGTEGSSRRSDPDSDGGSDGGGDGGGGDGGGGGD